MFTRATVRVVPRHAAGPKAGWAGVALGVPWLLAVVALALADRAQSDGWLLRSVLSAWSEQGYCALADASDWLDPPADHERLDRRFEARTTVIAPPRHGPVMMFVNPGNLPTPAVGDCPPIPAPTPADLAELARCGALADLDLSSLTAALAELHGRAVGQTVHGEDELKAREKALHKALEQVREAQAVHDGALAFAEAGRAARLSAEARHHSAAQARLRRLADRDRRAPRAPSAGTFTGTDVCIPSDRDADFDASIDADFNAGADAHVTIWTFDDGLTH